MKIIKKGTLPSDKVYSATCRACSSEIKFKRLEAKYNFDQRDGDFLTVQCPVCGEKIDVAA